MKTFQKSKRFLFWEAWLFYSSLCFACIGIALAFWGNSALFFLYDEMLASTFWQTSHLPPDVIYFKTFISGPLGGTLACTYLLLAFISHYAFREKQIWARSAIIISFGTWVIIDSLICLQFKVYPQIYFINATSILVKALPIIFTWKAFKTKS